MNQVKLKNLFYTEKSTHLIKNKYPHPSSLASYILLKKFYLNASREYNLPIEVRIYLNFRNKILKQRKKENKGNLVCFYCKEEYLDPNTNNPNNKREKATIDHYIPISKGGRKYDPDNIKVCCDSCNASKKDLMPEVFLKRINKAY